MRVLEIASLSVAYGPIPALDNVTLAVGTGRIVALIGANGAGKSTLMRTVSGLQRPQAGTILFAGQYIQGAAPHDIVRRGVALCPEGRRVFPHLTVRENLILGGYHRPKRELEGDLVRVYQLFPRLGERLRQRAGGLSGGEQQMLALGRALMSRPRLLLLDEPSLGLAPLLVQEVFKMLAQINREGTTMLLVEQNAVAALRLAHYGYLLENGRIILEGPSNRLLNDPMVQAAYLGG